MTKKSRKTMGKGRILLDFLAFIFAGAIFGFLALPFIKYEMVSAIGSVSATASGYGLLDFDVNSDIATVLLILIIFTSLAVVFAFLKILTDARIIRSRSVGKFISGGFLFLSFATLALAIAGMVVVPVNCSSGGLGSYFSAGTYAHWLGLIATMVSALISFIIGIFSVRK